MDNKSICNFKTIRAVILCVTIFFLLAMPVSALATGYYVKTSANGGNDINSGVDWNNAKATIQAAMDLADGSDTIYVAAGAYAGTVTFPEAHGIELIGGYPAAGGGTAAPWTNTTVIQGGGPVVSIPYNSAGGGQRSYVGLVIDGFTIKNGSVTSGYAAGIQSYSAGLTIKRCIVENNSGTGSARVGGIYVLSMYYDSSSVIFKLQESIIRNNTGTYSGGLFFDSIGYPQFQMINCLIYGNSATNTSAIYSVGGATIGSGAQTIGPSSITNCTIADNTSANSSVPVGGIAINTESWTNAINIKNSILWHSSLDDIYARGGSAYSISYSDIHDNDTGTSVIHTDPAFVGGGDYHLTSGSGGCIDGGTASGAPSTDLEGTTRVGYDMGAYEYGVPPAPDITVTDDKGATNDQQVPFGNVTEDESADATVTITNDGTENLEIGDIADANPLAAPFSITDVNCSSQTLTPGQSCDCTVTFEPAATGGFSDSFDIPSNDPDENPVTVSVSGTGTAAAAPDITVTDNKGATNDRQVPFGSVTVDDSTDATVTITNDGNQDLDIGTITDPTAPFSISDADCSGQTLASGENCVCTVTFAPTATGTFTDSFSIPSNDPDEASVTVQVSGTGTPVPAPDITVTDNKGTADDLEVPFGNVTEGETADAIVTITNDGDLDLVLSTITDPVAPFTIDASACSGQTLAPGADCACTVTFAPAAAGTFSGSFSIPSNDSDENPVTVSVSGTGVSATAQYTLTINKTGQGTVTPDVGDHDYNAGTVVDLTATPVEGWTFDGWDGNVADSDDSTTTTTMNSDKSVTAMFMEDGDNDGVPDEEEQGPDGNDATYDGNDDGTADSQQDNAASGHTHDDTYYVTLAVEDPANPNAKLEDARSGDNPHPSDSPDVDFSYGFFGFKITNVTPGSATVLVLYLDTAGPVPTTYYKYGPTPTDGTDHWYEFLYDGETGAEINNHEITLHFVDGQRGDDDLLANGVIIDQGAPSAPSSSTTGDNDNCFIATAAYGSPMESHVTVLREFRDRFLLASSAGKTFVELYYKYSPPVADFIGRHVALQTVVRIGLLPFVGMSYVTVHATLLQKIILILITLSFLMAIGMGIRSFKRRVTLS